MREWKINLIKFFSPNNPLQRHWGGEFAYFVDGSIFIYLVKYTSLVFLALDSNDMYTLRGSSIWYFSFDKFDI